MKTSRFLLPVHWVPGVRSLSCLAATCCQVPGLSNLGLASHLGSLYQGTCCLTWGKNLIWLLIPPKENYIHWTVKRGQSSIQRSNLIQHCLLKDMVCLNEVIPGCTRRRLFKQIAYIHGITLSTLIECNKNKFSNVEIRKLD